MISRAPRRGGRVPGWQKFYISAQRMLWVSLRNGETEGVLRCGMTRTQARRYEYAFRRAAVKLNLGKVEVHVISCGEPEGYHVSYRITR